MRKLKLIWFAAVLVVLALTLIYFDHRANSDIVEFEIWAMLALTFPSGWIWIFVAGLLKLFQLYSPFYVATSYISLSVIWLGFFLAGIFQWFIVVPFIASMRTKRGK